MQNELPFVAIEIRKKEPELSDHELETKSPHELMVASIANGISTQHCGGVFLGREHPSPVSMVNCNDPTRFVDILEQGEFCVEIPTESMTSDLLTEKLLKTEPKSRSKVLAKLMYEHRIPRVIVVAPQHICA